MLTEGGKKIAQCVLLLLVVGKRDVVHIAYPFLQITDTRVYLVLHFRGRGKQSWSSRGEGLADTAARLMM